MTAAMTDRHAQPCPCPACVAASAVLLLSTGRASMALSLLERLPDAIRDEIDGVHCWTNGWWSTETQLLRAELERLRAEVRELRARTSPGC
jgi:hypothetical protein